MSGKFIPAFYDRFLSSSDEIRNKFTHTNFQKQNEMLLKSLKLAAAATAGDLEGLQEIKARAESHDRHHLNIQPRLYEHWRVALIDTARVHDKQWNTAIEDAWNVILGHVIHRMTKFY
ncbi:MAG: globin [Rhodopirellula sp.]|nr:globin [Rhodopirellula sp.]